MTQRHARQCFRQRLFPGATPDEYETPHIAAIMFAPPSPVAALRAGGSQASSSDPCTEVMYMIDPDLAAYIGSCDPDSGDLGTLGPIENEAWSRCMEAMVDPDGDVIPTEDNPYGFGGGFVWAMRGIDRLNSAGTINPDGSLTWHGFTKAEAMQSGTIVPKGTPASPASRARCGPSLSSGRRWRRQTTLGPTASADAHPLSP